MADNNYYSRRQQSEEVAGQPRFNITEAMKERTGRSRNDDLDKLLPKSRHLHGISVDPEFGVGYEVIDPAPSRNLDHRGARAQKLGYNRELQYLAIKMRDGTMCGYDGVPVDTWLALGQYESTTDFIDYELSGWSNNVWNTVLGQPPQSQDQNFEQGTID